MKTSARNSIPPPALLYAMAGAGLAVALVTLIVVLISDPRASAAAEAVLGAAVIGVLALTVWLLFAAEERRRQIYQWRSRGLELAAIYERDHGDAKAFMKRFLDIEADLRDAGAYADAEAVAEARRRVRLLRVEDVKDSGDAGSDQ